MIRSKSIDPCRELLRIVRAHPGIRFFEIIGKSRWQWTEHRDVDRYLQQLRREHLVEYGRGGRWWPAKRTRRPPGVRAEHRNEGGAARVGGQCALPLDMIGTYDRSTGGD